MKRYEIRQQLGRERFTDAQLRGAIARLNLPTGDDYDYTPEQSEQIKSALLQVGQPRNSSGSEPSSFPGSDRHKRGVSLADQHVSALAISSIEESQQQVVGAQQVMQILQKRRESALENLSNEYAYLTDETIFLYELEVLTQTKKQAAQEQRTLTLTKMAADFEDAYKLETFEYPAFASSSVAGCLPM